MLSMKEDLQVQMQKGKMSCTKLIKEILTKFDFKHSVIQFN